MSIKNPETPFVGKAETLTLDDGGTVFRFTGEQGDISMTSYHVFPGMDLIYNDIHIQKSMADVNVVNSNKIEIDHCREGRLECQVGKDYFYLAPGDVSIHRLGESVREEIYSTGHYHGITVQIDLDKTPKCLACFLDDVNVEPAAIAEKFRLRDNFFFALRLLPSIEHIFSELYSVPQSVQRGYFKVRMPVNRTRYKRRNFYKTARDF